MRQKARYCSQLFHIISSWDGKMCQLWHDARPRSDLIVQSKCRAKDLVSVDRTWLCVSWLVWGSWLWRTAVCGLQLRPSFVYRTWLHQVGLEFNLLRRDNCWISRHWTWIHSFSKCCKTFFTLTDGSKIAANCCFVYTIIKRKCHEHLLEFGNYAMQK